MKNNERKVQIKLYNYVYQIGFPLLIVGGIKNISNDEVLIEAIRININDKKANYSMKQLVFVNASEGNATLQNYIDLGFSYLDLQLHKDLDASLGNTALNVPPFEEKEGIQNKMLFLKLNKDYEKIKNDIISKCKNEIIKAYFENMGYFPLP